MSQTESEVIQELVAALIDLLDASTPEEIQLARTRAHVALDKARGEQS